MARHVVVGEEHDTCVHDIEVEHKLLMPDAAQAGAMLLVYSAHHKIGHNNTGMQLVPCSMLCAWHAGHVPESVCTVVLLGLMALLLLMACSFLPAAQASQQQVILLTQGIVHLPLLLTNLKHSCQLCLQQHQADR